MIDKKFMFDLLDSANELFPICIPSYKRWDRKENKTITHIIEQSGEDIRSNTYVFVRKEQEKEYKESFPTVNIVALPPVNGLAGTRQFICDYVLDVLKKPYFMDMDDDITDLKAVINDGKTRLTRAGEVDAEKVIKLGCEISKIAFEADRCLLGSMRRVRFANKRENAETAYITNKGATPRQVMYINAYGLKKKGIRRNMMFDPTGDDVGFVAEISKVGGNMFNIPCLAYSFVDDAVNSVIRNDSNRKKLAQYEYDCIKKYPMRNYMRIPFKFEDGSYKFCDIDFTKYRKISGNKSRAVPLNVFGKIMEKNK